ncbi:MAG: redoxin domain-containing protein, partial [Alphaproteobacteria bacterium]
MRKSVLMSSAVAAAFIGVIGVAGLQVSLAAPSPSVTAPVKVAEKVDNFQLTDQTRLAHELYYFKAAPAIVIMSQTNGSPLSREAAAELSKLQAAYAAKGVLFYMVNSNLSNTRDATAVEADKQKFTIPVLMDEKQLVGENMGIAREGEVFVISPKDGFKVAYHGPLDERFTKASPNLKAAAKDAYTAKAIDAVLSGGTVEKARIDVTVGKTIAFPERDRSADFVKISYAKDVAPIVKDKCVTCHEKGGIAPFAFDSYEKVKGFAPMIRETVRSQRMPPYFADPHIGHFKSDQ